MIWLFIIFLIASVAATSWHIYKVTYEIPKLEREIKDLKEHIQTLKDLKESIQILEKKQKEQKS